MRKIDNSGVKNYLQLAMIVIEQFCQDILYAIRGWWRAKGFTAGAIAVLAFGIGANLALWQLLDAMIVHRYSIPDADSFVRLSRISRDGLSRTFPSSPIEFYRANSNHFSAL